MKAEDVIKQLRSRLPRFTNYFSDEFQIISLTRSGTTVTAVTSTDHNLQTGYYVHINNAITPFSINSLTRVGDIATAITNNAHDLTENWPTDKPNVSIIDANEAEYNGSHELLTVPNRKTFTYDVQGEPATPATGTPKLLSVLYIGYNGWHQVIVINSTTFTYEIDTEPESPALGDNITARTRARISGAVTAQRALDSYTEQKYNELWAFVVPGNTVANKDRAVFTDSTAKYGKGEDYRQEIIAPFSIYIITPASNDIAGRHERDLMEDLLRPLTKSLLRFKFPTGLIEDPYSGCIFSSHGFFDYVGSYYVHEFVFETTGWLVEADTLDFEPNVAFRDIFINYGSSFETSNDIIMTDHVDLDDEPLN